MELEWIYFDIFIFLNGLFIWCQLYAPTGYSMNDGLSVGYIRFPLKTQHYNYIILSGSCQGKHWNYLITCFAMDNDLCYLIQFYSSLNTLN